MLADAHAPHVYLYDGVCALCSGAVRFLLKHDRRRRFRFAALQSRVARDALARHGISTDRLDTFWVLRDAGTAKEAALSHSRAVIFLCRELGLPWSLFTLATAVPRGLLDAAYETLARNRYRWFGKFDQCVLSAPGHEDRFLSDPPEGEAAPPPP